MKNVNFAIVEVVSFVEGFNLFNLLILIIKLLKKGFVMRSDHGIRKLYIT